MNVRKLFLLCLLLVFLMAPIHAEEETGISTDILQEALPEEAAEVMPNISPEEDFDFWTYLKQILLSGVGKSSESLRSGLRLCAILLAVVLLCSVVSLASSDTHHNVFCAAGALGICAAMIGTFQSMMSLASDTVRQLTDYTACLMPVLASAAAMSGGMNASAALYAGTMLFSELLMQLISKALIPCVFFYLAIATAEAAFSSDALAELREFIGWLISKSLRVMLFVFLLYMSVTGVISGSTDAAAVKATKAAMSGMVPVVGGILSDASETLLASVSVLKSTIGAFGMIAVFAVCFVPFLRVGIHYLMLKVTAAISGTVGQKEHVKLLKNCSEAMGYLLAMCGTCSLLVLISCVCFMKVVT